MSKTYIGIDNGVSGTIGVVSREYNLFIKTPTIKQQSYTKKKQNISRLDYNSFYYLLENYVGKDEKIVVVFERPFVNPTGFKATASALRCLEAQLIAIEMLDLPYQYIDSKEWQKELLPKGFKGKELKKASCDIGIRIFPELKAEIIKHKDADGLLIAEWARRKRL